MQLNEELCSMTFHTLPQYHPGCSAENSMEQLKAEAGDRTGVTKIIQGRCDHDCKQSAEY